jgi:predicted PurR-regulated permease PerM
LCSARPLLCLPGMADERAVTNRWKLPNALGIVFSGLLGIVILLFLWKTRSFLLTLFLAIVAGLALSAAADWLETRRVRRTIGAPATMFLVVGSLAGLFAFLGPSLREQVGQLSSELPKLVKRADEWVAKIQKTPAASAVTGQATSQQAPPKKPPQQGGQQAQQAPPRGSLQDLLARQTRTAGRVLFPVVSSVFEVIAGILIIIFVAIYVAVDPKTYRQGILHLVPHQRRARAAEVMDDVAETLRGWLMARVIAAVIIGVVTAGSLMLLRIDAAIALGIIAGLLEFIPFFGPIISAIPAIGVALVQSPQKAIYVVLLYVAIQQLEGNVLTPLLLKKRLEIPPILTIAVVTAFGVVFGVLGMLAAEPLLAAVLLLVKRLYVEDVIGDEVA